MILGGALAGTVLAETMVEKADAAKSGCRVVSPEEWGALGHDGRDHTGAFERMFSAAAGGAIVLPPGTYHVRGDRLRLLSATPRLGYGRGSVLRRIGDGTRLDVSGTSSLRRNGGCLLRDVVLDGGGGGGPLVRCHYAHDIVFDNVWSRFNAGVGLDAVEVWDSKFVNCTWDWCSGRDGVSPYVLLRNKTGADDPGLSNTNAVSFVNCRWESFLDGALWLTEVGPQSISQIHLLNCKMETSHVRGSFLRISRAVRDITVQNLLTSA